MIGAPRQFGMRVFRPNRGGERPPLKRTNSTGSIARGQAKCEEFGKVDSAPPWSSNLSEKRSLSSAEIDTNLAKPSEQQTNTNVTDELNQLDPDFFIVPPHNGYQVDLGLAPSPVDMADDIQITLSSAPQVKRPRISNLGSPELASPLLSFLDSPCDQDEKPHEELLPRTTIDQKVGKNGTFPQNSSTDPEKPPLSQPNTFEEAFTIQDEDIKIIEPHAHPKAQNNNENELEETANALANAHAAIGQSLLEAMEIIQTCRSYGRELLKNLNEHERELYANCSKMESSRSKSIQDAQSLVQSALHW